MNKDRIAGATKQVAGAVKETIGTTFWDARMAAEGKLEKAAGKLQSAVGVIKEKLAKKQ